MSSALMRSSAGVAAFAALTVAAGVAHGEASPPNAGRFTMQPVDGGMLRLDTETGDVSLCTRKNDAWQCEPVKDSRGSIADLAEENKALKEHIKSLEEGLSHDGGGAVAPPPLPPPAGDKDNGYPTEPPPGSANQLPTEKDIDQAFDYVERMYKKLRERIEKLDKDLPPPPADTPPDTPPGAPAEKGGKSL